MEEKRLFQILDDLNLKDCEDKKGRVGVNGSFVGAQKAKGGCHVTIGAPESVLFDIMSGKIMVLLVTIDKEEYEKQKSIE